MENKENTCGGCTEYDDGFCDRFGVLVEEDDSCRKPKVQPKEDAPS